MEFILLLAVMIGFSLLLLTLVNGHIAEQWVALANKIVGPGPVPETPLRLR